MTSPGPAPAGGTHDRAHKLRSTTRSRQCHRYDKSRESEAWLGWSLRQLCKSRPAAGLPSLFNPSCSPSGNPQCFPFSSWPGRGAKEEDSRTALPATQPLCLPCHPVPLLPCPLAVSPAAAGTWTALGRALALGWLPRTSATGCLK